MFKFKIFFTVFLLAWVLSACSSMKVNPSTGTTHAAALVMPSANPANIFSTTQDDFWTKAAQGGMAEVEISQLAEANAQRADVKQFAKMMVSDHSKANSELKGLAAKKKVTLPTTIDADHQSLKDRLSGLKGADFDSAYIDAMVQDHEGAVSLFSDQAQNGTDPEVKAWAAKTLPKLQGHLDKIKAIQAVKK
jgi:putative membrane protein